MAFLLLASCGGGGSGGTQESPVQFPGVFWLIDRGALYDPAHTLLSNGGFESDSGGIPTDWQFLAGPGGAPVADRVPDGTGYALRVTTVTGNDRMTVVSPSLSLSSEVERYYLSFEARTDFGMLDEGWGGVGTEEQGAGSSSIAVQAAIRWGFAGGTFTETIARRVHHALHTWRPHLSEVTVPGGAVTAQVRFTVAGNVPNETSEPHETFLDNVRFFPEPASLLPRRIEGSASRAPDGSLLFSGSIPGFRLEATSTGGNVSGDLVNLTGKNVAVDLLYALELEAARVDYDISRGSVVAGATRYYSDPVSADWYSDLTMSPVPLGSVTSPSGSTTGLAIPLSPLRIVLFRYDARLRSFEAVHRFGLRGTGLHDRASFSVHVLRSESSWKYRELWRRYVTEIEPVVSSIRRPAPGGTGAFYAALFDTTQPGVPPFYPDLAGMIQDFGLRTVLERIGSLPPISAGLLDRLQTYNLEALNYDYPWILETEAGDATAPPASYEGAEATVAALVAGTPTSTFGKLRKIQAQKALRDSRGDLRINRNFAPSFSGGRWLLRIPTNLRPDQSEYLETTLTEKFLPAFDAGAAMPEQRIVGANFDGFMKESKVLDDRSEAAGDSPLTYDPDTGEPVAHLADGNLSFLNALRARLDASGHGDKRMSGNLTASGPSIFGMPLLDQAGWESSPAMGVNFDHREFNLRRMMLPGKPLAVIFKGEWWNVPGHQDALRRFFESAALLGVYPNIIESHTPPPPLMDGAQQDWYRSLYREVIPVLDAMHAAGWQVIPYAEFVNASGDAAGSEALRVERFGSGASVYFAVLNNRTGVLNDPTTSAQSVRLTVDLAPLGMEGAPTPMVAFGQATLVWQALPDGRLEIRFDLEAGEGVILKIGG